MKTLQRVRGYERVAENRVGYKNKESSAEQKKQVARFCLIRWEEVADD